MSHDNLKLFFRSGLVKADEPYHHTIPISVSIETVKGYKYIKYRIFNMNI